MTGDGDTPQSPLLWTDDGQPRSRLYGDVYFSAQDGLAESRAVFLRGCGLPARWRDRRRFVVGELGFGTGLNIAALLDLWRAEQPAGHLHIFSVEAHPLAAAEAARALAPWPELAPVTDLLLARWPGRARGVHRVDLPELAATLDVAVMDVGPALAGWTGGADAWFLDGFSPALNPGMWRDEVLALVAARCAPGAVAATFTVAGSVRRGLAAAGFAVAKQPGFGRKRERLEAVMPGEPPPERPVRVAIVGGGIAAAAAARAIRALGGEVVVVEAEGPGAGGSGNPAALVTPRLDAGLGPPALLFAEAFHRAVRLYAGVPGAVLQSGVRQLAASDRDPARFARIAASDLFEPGSLVVHPAPAALDQTAALLVDPAPILAAWLGRPLIAQVARLDRDSDAWVLQDAAGREIARADAVILAAGQASAALAPNLDLDLTPVRGQLSWAPGIACDTPATVWGGYAAGSPHGLIFGATHDRGDTATDLRPADHDRNLATLAARLSTLAAQVAQVAGLPLVGRAAVRATTRDRAPLAGPAPGAAGLYLLTGFGSRGFSLAPWLAEHVAALALGAPSPLAADLARLVDPGRFAERMSGAISGGPDKAYTAKSRGTPSIGTEI